MTDSERWTAVVTNDKGCDGKFFYGVKSTGIYCRPSCASRQPNPKNIVYFDSRQEAEQAGFRPCKRCRPDLAACDPAAELAAKAKAILDGSYADPPELARRLNDLGVTRRHLTALFEKRFDLSPEQYLAQVRLRRAKELLAAGCSVTEAAFAVGMESPASFSAFFKRQAGVSPREYALQRAAERPACFCETPLGLMRLEENQHGITALRFAGGAAPAPCGGNGLYLADAKLQLAEYFAKKRKAFEVPLAAAGSEFQNQVWSALCRIPYGETRSYQEVAEAIGRKEAARAVGMANNRNPILIMIPCHRVVGKDGKLVGYAGGIDRKQALLELEST